MDTTFQRLESGISDVANNGSSESVPQGNRGVDKGFVQAQYPGIRYKERAWPGIDT